MEKSLSVINALLRSKNCLESDIMLQIVGCPDTTCKHNRDGIACMCCTVKHDTVTINNKTYNVCVTYEDNREESNNENKNI